MQCLCLYETPHFFKNRAVCVKALRHGGFKGFHFPPARFVYNGGEITSYIQIYIRMYYMYILYLSNIS
jgi:hypothetical protein